MNDTLSLIASIALALIGFAAGRMYQMLHDLRQQNNELRARIEAMEKAGPKRLPNRAAEMIMNGIAALNYEEFDLEDRKGRIANAREWFKRAMSLDK